jgi:hypothetical protein
MPELNITGKRPWPLPIVTHTVDLPICWSSSFMYHAHSFGTEITHINYCENELKFGTQLNFATRLKQNYLRKIALKFEFKNKLPKTANSKPTFIGRGFSY